jgi:hypothetical protein
MSAQTSALAPAARGAVSGVADARAFALPDAAQILGAVWRALDLQFPKRRAQSGRKLLRGDRPGSDQTRAGVLRDMARAFVDAGYVHVVDRECEGVRHRDRAVEEIARSLAHAIAHWDRFVGIRRALARPVDESDVLRYVRLAAIDIALRTAAFDLSFGWCPPPEACGMTFDDAPIWAREGGVREWLRALPKALGATREELHPGKTKDDWFYREARPSIASIATFAASLAAFDGAPHWRMYLAWAFALDALCDQLAALVGREPVEELAAMFWRLRCLVWQIVAGVDPVHRGALVEPIVRAGAHCETAHLLIDRIATLDGIAAINGGTLDDRAAMLAMALRACEGVWIFGDVFPHAHVPLAAPDVPEEVQRQLLAAMAPGADPAAFSLAACSHPASLVWALRLVVQRATLGGSFAQVAPAVANLADVLGDAELRLDAVMLYLFSGDFVEARRRLAALGGPQAEALGVVLALVDGRASEAIPILASLAADDHSLSFLLATALAESGRHADALELALDLLDDEPGNALALALAARCAWALGETRAGNAYAKDAARLGQPLERPAVRRQRGGRARRSGRRRAGASA